MPLHWLGSSFDGSNVDDTSDQARFTEVFLPHLVDAFRLARWIAGSRAGPLRGISAFDFC